MKSIFFILLILSSYCFGQLTRSPLYLNDPNETCFLLNRGLNDCQILRLSAPSLPDLPQSRFRQWMAKNNISKDKIGPYKEIYIPLDNTHPDDSWILGYFSEKQFDFKKKQFGFRGEVHNYKVFLGVGRISNRMNGQKAFNYNTLMFSLIVPIGTNK